MTAGALANIITIHDKLVRLILEESSPKIPLGSNVVLLGAGPRHLGWNEQTLEIFLKGPVQAKFGVTVSRKAIKLTLNGADPTVGDLSIAIFNAIYKQQRPRISSWVA